MTRSPQAFTLHNLTIAGIAAHFTAIGHTNVRADHVGHTNGAPAQIGSHIPDITASELGTGRPIICEVETGDTIGLQHTFEQLRTFRTAANMYGGFLHVGLPHFADIAPAQLLVASWGITVDQWWYSQA